MISPIPQALLRCDLAMILLRAYLHTLEYGWLFWQVEYGGNDADSSNEALNCLSDLFLLHGSQSLCKICDNPGTTLLWVAKASKIILY